MSAFNPVEFEIKNARVFLDMARREKPTATPVRLQELLVEARNRIADVKGLGDNAPENLVDQLAILEENINTDLTGGKQHGAKSQN